MPIADTAHARATILAALRAGRGPTAEPSSGPDLAPFLSGPFARGALVADGAAGAAIDPATLVAPFEAAARGWRADVLRAGVADWPQAVRAALDRAGCRRIALGAGSALRPELEPALAGLEVRRFEQPLEQWKAELFGAVDAGVTDCEAGIADTGTLVLRPGPHEPRTLSLVPPVHVAVLRASRLHASFAAALRALQPERAMPTNWVFVSGPSKTADIQQTLAYGAHGPKALVIVLVDDLARGG